MSSEDATTRRWHVAARTVKTIIAFGVTVAAAVYLVQALHGAWGDFTRPISDTDVMRTAGILSLAYGAIFFILFSSWYLTLRDNAPQAVPIAHGAYIYCIANIGKYLPGNIFHFAGRQILGARAGWPHRAIARATLLEIAAIVAGILLLILLAAAFGPARAIASVIPNEWHAASPYARLAGFCGLAVFFLSFLLSKHLGVFGRLFRASPKAVARAVAMCATFFCCYAVLVAVFAYHLPIARNGPPLLAIGIIYLIAWLAGFVVPGAPGGLGVRESVLVVLLTESTDVERGMALSLGLGLRFISTMGDVVALGSAYLLNRRWSPHRPPFHSANGASDG